MNQQNKLLDRKILNERYDKTLIWVLISLIVFGLVMIYSASVDGRIRNKVDSEYFYIIRQGVFFFISVVLGLIGFATISMKKLQKLTPIIVGVSLFLLIFVLFLGTEVNGAKRWIRIFGIFNIQPAELFKFAVILYLASYLYRKFEVLTEFKKIWFVGIVPAVGAALILMSGDLGSTVIIFVITLAMLFMAGLRMSWFLIIMAIGFLGAVFSILITPYRVERIMTFLHPESDPLGAGFQTIQSFVANANGGIWGVGLGNGMARYGLPELHTDFIASFITEELGVVALIILCFVYIWITVRAFSIGKKASDLDLFYSSFVAKGIGVWIGIQALLHIGINTGTLPTKGLTLPFVSYGGSSLLVGVLAITVLLRIDYENRRKTLGFDT
ncbi:putative lipid II flippase FtsW [Neisseriaceae bacterium PsAf]|nr:putative lipid II flippase FtsW [Neisseriaceae bacterium PsAf]MCV2503108.1 putative lipid II flippase FtsW [Neisseriaceae bacterium]